MNIADRTPTPLPLGLSSPDDGYVAAPPTTSTQAVSFDDQLLPGFSSNLLVQGMTSDADKTMPDVIAHAGVGVVYTIAHTRARSHFQSAAVAVSTTRAAAPSADMLIDRNRYSGNERAYAADSPISKQWVADQHQKMKLRWAVADSGFCRDLAEVATLLDQGSRLKGEIIIPIPIPHDLLAGDAAALTDHINQQSHPVALILQHEADPCGQPGVVAGLLHVLRHARQQILLLRFDTSALGGIAHGAAAAAIGTRSGLRHIYPLSAGGGIEHLSFVIGDLLSYVLGTRFSEAYLRDSALPLWACDCWFCHGRDLVWIPNAEDPTAAAFQHSAAVLARLGTQLSDRATSIGAAAAWDHMCTSAQVAHDQVTNPSGSGWDPKPFLRYWHEEGATAPVS